MDAAFSRNSLASKIPTVEKFARLFVEMMTDPESKADSAFGSVTEVEGDNLSFVVHIHRKAVRFEFGHVLISALNGKVLGGHYSIFLVNKKGEWLPEKDSLILWSDERNTQIRFGDKDYYEVSWSPSPHQASQIRDKVKTIALNVAQAELAVLNY